MRDDCARMPPKDRVRKAMSENPALTTIGKLLGVVLAVGAIVFAAGGMHTDVQKLKTEVREQSEYGPRLDRLEVIVERIDARTERMERRQREARE